MGKLPALYKRHDALAEEMKNRGYRHSSPLEKSRGSQNQDKLLNTIEEQEKILRDKPCECLVA